MAPSLPLEVFVYLAGLVAERDLIRLSLASRRIRATLLAVPFLWTRCLTVEISDPGMSDQIQTLFIDRAVPPLHLHPHVPVSGSIARWIKENDQTEAPRPLKKMVIRLTGPSVTLDERSNRLLFNQEQHYWNTGLLAHNIRILRRLLCSTVGHQNGLECLEVRLDGQFENTLLAAHEIWSFVQTPWARTVVDYRFTVGYPYARLPPRAIIALTSWMPNLTRLEMDVSASSGHRRAANREVKVILGTSEFSEPSNHQANTCNLERLGIAGFDLSQMILPCHFPRLVNLELRNFTWSRMIFDLFRKSPSLCSVLIWSFEFEVSDGDDDLPADWPFWDSIEEEMSEPGSEDIGPRPPAITLSSLRTLELGGICTPAIWNVLGEPIPNPIIKMPNLKKLILESMELEEEEHALHELPGLAPLIREFSVRGCSLRDEADLYHCIKCLPYLEVLDLKQTEHITSNLVNALALSVPNIVHLDVRGCGWVQIASVARLAETVRDSSDGMRRLAHVGVDLPLPEDWEGWEAWRWLEFTHVLIDEEEWREKRRFKKDKGRERDETCHAVIVPGLDVCQDPNQNHQQNNPQQPQHVQVQAHGGGGRRNEVLGSVVGGDESEDEEDEEDDEDEELESEEDFIEEDGRGLDTQQQVQAPQSGGRTGSGAGEPVDSGGGSNGADNRQEKNQRVVLTRT